MGDEKPKKDKTPRKDRPGPGWKGKLISAGVVLAAATLVAVVAFAVPARDPDVPPTERRPVDVEVMEVKPVPFLPDTFTAPGDVEPYRVSNVPAEVAGRVEELPVREGARVRAGDAVVRLNTDLLQAEVDRTAAQASYDKREYERLQEVVARGAATPREVEAARAAMEVSKAHHESARTNLERADIRARIDGILDRRMVEIGEYVSPGVVVGRVVDMSRVKMAVAVPERDVHFLEAGDEAMVINDRVRTTGPVTYISEEADEQTRTSRVEVTVDNPERQFRSGQMVRVVFTRREIEDALMVPLAALERTEHGYEVYVVEEGEARRRRVEPAPPYLRQWVRIAEGLSPGDRLIVEGRQYVADGQPVRVLDEQPAPDLEALLTPRPSVDPTVDPRIAPPARTAP